MHYGSWTLQPPDGGSHALLAKPARCPRFWFLKSFLTQDYNAIFLCCYIGSFMVLLFTVKSLICLNCDFGLRKGSLSSFLKKKDCFDTIYWFFSHQSAMSALSQFWFPYKHETVGLWGICHSGICKILYIALPAMVLGQVLVSDKTNLLT